MKEIEKKINEIFFQEINYKKNFFFYFTLCSSEKIKILQIKFIQKNCPDELFQELYKFLSTYNLIYKSNELVSLVLDSI